MRGRDAARVRDGRVQAGWGHQRSTEVRSVQARGRGVFQFNVDAMYLTARHLSCSEPAGHPHRRLGWSFSFLHRLLGASSQCSWLYLLEAASCSSWSVTSSSQIVHDVRPIEIHPYVNSKHLESKVIQCEKSISDVGRGISSLKFNNKAISRLFRHVVPSRLRRGNAGRPSTVAVRQVFPWGFLIAFSLFS